MGRVRSCLFTAGSMAAPRSQCLSKLTRRHGVKIAAAVSVEDCCLAIGGIVGHDHILSASKMNSATVIFLSSVEKANALVETGLTIDGLFTPVLPLSVPSKKVILSNIPPFISDETLVRILSRYGKIVSSIKMIPIGCTSPLLKHVISFRRFVYMILNEDEELELSLHLKVDEYDYVIYATTEKMKCFNCGGVGHLVRACPNKDKNSTAAADGEVAQAGTSNTAVSEMDTAKNKVVEEPLNESAEVFATERLESTTGSASILSEVRAKDDKGESSASRIRLPIDDGLEMETEQTSFKIPTKRKKPGDYQVVKAKKADVVEDGMESGSESSDSSVSLSQIDFQNTYEADDIRLFLRATKNKRGVRVEQFFPDYRQFVDKARLFMSEGLFTNKEVYRLKKIVRKVASDLAEDGDGKD